MQSEKFHMDYSYYISIHNKYYKIITKLEYYINLLYRYYIYDSHQNNILLEELQIIKDKNSKKMVKLGLTDKYVIKKNKHMKILEIIKNDNPFISVKNRILSFMIKNGSCYITTFLKLYFHNFYFYYLDNQQNYIIKLYSKIFIPISIEISKSDKPNYIYISKKDTNNRNECTINLILNSQNIIFIGYIFAVPNDPLYNNYIDQIESNILEKIDSNHIFFQKFTKMINKNIYFIYDIDFLVRKTKEAYSIYEEISKKDYLSIVTTFLEESYDNKFYIITSLLIGNDNQIISASLLMKTLNENNKIVYDSISQGLSNYAIKIINNNESTLQLGLEKLNLLKPKLLSIENRIATVINMPTYVKEYILNMVNGKDYNSDSKIQVAINGLLKFPWKPNNPINEYDYIGNNPLLFKKYLKKINKKMNREIYGHEESKRTFIEIMAKWIGNPIASGNIIGLVGPPGVGKTLFAKSISNILNIGFAKINLGGMNDVTDLIGHNYTYVNAQYGLILRNMINLGHWRIVLFFDELDKLTTREKSNEIYNALIHITDNNSNKNFQDRFYPSIDFDLSSVLIIFSYNSSRDIDPILLDRINEIKIEPYSVKDKIIITQDYLLNDLCMNINLKKSKIKIKGKLIQYIIEKYTNEIGIRDLNRKLEKILLKLNIDRIYLSGPFEEKINSLIDTKKKSKIVDQVFKMDFEDPIVLQKKDINIYLGPEINQIKIITVKKLIGNANGLYATTSGIGGIMPIQIYKNYVNKKSNKIRITGNQKKIMKESILCAFTCICNLIKAKKLKNRLLDFPHGFHLHTPDASSVKEGPSAGAAIAIAFVSILLNLKISNKIAITGEIQLTGQLSKIGSLDIKLLAAKNAGIEIVFISQDNIIEYEKFKGKHIDFKKVKVKLVNHIMEIILDPCVFPSLNAKDFYKF